MSQWRRRCLSAFLGTGLLLLLLAIVSFDHRYRREPPLQTVPLTEVRIYEPPPPPPPVPPDFSESSLAGPAISIAQNETQVALEIMELDVTLAMGNLGDFGIGGLGLGDGAGAAFETVSLSDLDTSPIVTGAPPIVYPEEAIERGIDEFEVRVHVLVNEQGRARLIRIIENPVASFSPTIEEFVTQVVFSPPTRLGVPVRAEYVWPLLISCRAMCEGEPPGSQTNTEDQ